MIGHRVDIECGTVQIRSSGREEGSFALGESAVDLGERRRALLGPNNHRPWVALQQIHGASVFLPEASDEPNEALPHADAAVCFDDRHAVSVVTADCAPVVLVASTGVAVVHAGWRGAAAGVISAAADVLNARGSVPVMSFLGPCIQPAAYEFQPADLEPVIALFGRSVVGATADGASALDLTRVVQLSCERAGWPVPDRPQCTSGAEFYSHRTRADLGRQATVAWIEPHDPARQRAN